MLTTEARVCLGNLLDTQLEFQAEQLDAESDDLKLPHWQVRATRGHKSSGKSLDS